MHDADKIGRALLGLLTRSRMRQIINPFDDGIRLLNKVREAAKHFSYGTTRSLELDRLDPTACDIRLQLDLNGTRVAAQKTLLESILRRSKGLSPYMTLHKPSWTFTPDDWVTVTELHGILKVVGTATTLAQFENVFPAAFSFVIKSSLLETLRGGTLEVVELSLITKNPRLPTISKPVIEFTPVGYEALQRAILETERRFCGNTSEEIQGLSVTVTDLELLASILDVRTKSLGQLSIEDRDKAKALLRTTYIAFAEKAWLHNKSAREAEEMAKKRKAAEAELHALELAAQQAKSRVEAFTPGIASTAASAGLVLQTANSVTSGPPAKVVLQSLLYQEHGSWGDSDSGDENAAAAAGGAPEAVEDAAQTKIERLIQFGLEADASIKAWRKIAVPWWDLYSSAALPEKLNLVEHLLPLNPGAAYKYIAKLGTCGLIPQMAMCSEGELGAVNAESYCERVLSCAKNVMPDGRTLLSSDELEMIVMLRMNKGFMQHMRETYPGIAKEKFGRVVVG
jgi:hypothetical protein